MPKKHSRCRRCHQKICRNSKQLTRDENYYPQEAQVFNEIKVLQEGDTLKQELQEIQLKEQNLLGSSPQTKILTGSGVFTVPKSFNIITLEIWGAGGGSGGVTPGLNGGGGGGGGAYVQHRFQAANNPEIRYNVGVGGAAPKGFILNGTNGGNTQVTCFNFDTPITLTARGGSSGIGRLGGEGGKFSISRDDGKDGKTSVGLIGGAGGESYPSIQGNLLAGRGGNGGNGGNNPTKGSSGSDGQIIVHYFAV